MFTWEVLYLPQLHRFAAPFCHHPQELLPDSLPIPEPHQWCVEQLQDKAGAVRQAHPTLDSHTFYLFIYWCRKSGKKEQKVKWKQQVFCFSNIFLPSLNPEFFHYTNMPVFPRMERGISWCSKKQLVLATLLGTLDGLACHRTENITLNSLSQVITVPFFIDNMLIYLPSGDIVIFIEINVQESLIISQI